MSLNSWLFSKMCTLLAKFGFSPEDLHLITTSSSHSPYVANHRASIINERIKVISLVFTLMILLWLPLDFALLPNAVAVKFSLLRFITSLSFLALALSITKDNDKSHAYLRLMEMMLIAVFFYAISAEITHGVDTSGGGQVLVGIYEYLPFLIVAGLALFPLTLIEVIVAGFSIFIVIGSSATINHTITSPIYYSAAWMLILILGADALSAAIQLKYMSSLLHRISLDKLTGALSRQAGAEMLELHFELSAEKGKPFAIAFVDLDYFKSINDEYGHDAGDAILIQAVKVLSGTLRRGDQIIRWGGEEFLVMLPDAEADGIKLVVDRIKGQWLGIRPDNKKLTASIGIAERISDNAKSWGELVKIADTRMYKAKQSGRAQIIFN